VRAHHQTPERAGQHQQEAEPDEAHADDGCRRPRAEREGDGDRHGADRREADADGDDDERAAVGGRNERRHIDGWSAGSISATAAAALRHRLRYDACKVTPAVEHVVSSGNDVRVSRQD